MSMQTDVRTSQPISTYFLPPALTGKWLPFRTSDVGINVLGGPIIGRCRIKAITIQQICYNDGYGYGGVFKLASYDGTEAFSGTPSILFAAEFPGPLYSPSYTITLLFPGEGILVKDNLYFYAAGDSEFIYQVIYG